MTIMNRKHAMKMLRKAVDSRGVIGNDQVNFANQFFSMQNRRPTQDEINHLYAALDEGEQKRVFYVKRDVLGSPIAVEKFDYEKASAVSEPNEPVEQPNPKIDNLQLLPLMHATLYGQCNSDDVLISGCTVPVLMAKLHQELSRDYDLHINQVNEVFEAMRHLNLRGNAAKLREQGMWVAQPKEAEEDDVSEKITKERLTHDLDQAQAQVEDLKRQLSEQAKELRGQLEERTEQYKQLHIDHRDLIAKHDLLQEENSGVMTENGQLTDENERQAQSIVDLRTRNQELADIAQRVYDIVAECNKNA